jgi:hypothetical protein
MSERNPRVRGFDARLASLDQRLAAIQHELAPDPESWAAPAGEGPAPAPARERAERPPPRETAELASQDADLLHGLYPSLLASNRQLLDGYEAALGRLARRRTEPPRRDTVAEATLSAGPFRSTTSLSEFERVLGELPDVREVALRGYESGNRAILDVRLDEETP